MLHEQRDFCTGDVKRREKGGKRGHSSFLATVRKRECPSFGVSYQVAATSAQWVDTGSGVSPERSQAVPSVVEEMRRRPLDPPMLLPFERNLVSTGWGM
jgi:hypothetical protein